MRPIRKGEQGEYILKPIPNIGKRPEQMPANEHLTMQIASQVYGIETALNALTFFKSGEPAYIVKRFDLRADGSKRRQEDFAALAQRTPQTHGEHYKYLGNYLELFELLRQYAPAYNIEAPKLLKLILFNYLFSNGDAHVKNFSLLETGQGDFKLSPAYDLLNTRMHIDDEDFALNDGLLPKNLGQGTIRQQFELLASKAGLSPITFDKTLNNMLSHSEKVERLTFASFLQEKSQRSYWQLYRRKLKRLLG